jgi:hypothetical protein
MNALTDRSDEELLRGIDSHLGSERQSLAHFVGYLGEVEQRRLHLRAGYASMFDFCTRKFCLSEGEAFRRITAARLSRRFPVIPELLERGAVHLSALVLLRDHLTDDNHSELLREAVGKSKLELQELLAARFPQPDVPSRMRKLPLRNAGLPPGEQSRLELRSAPARGAELDASVARATPTPAQRGLLQPLSPGRYKVQFTVDRRSRTSSIARETCSVTPTRLAIWPWSLTARWTCCSRIWKRRYWARRKDRGGLERALRVRSLAPRDERFLRETASAARS